MTQLPQFLAVFAITDDSIASKTTFELCFIGSLADFLDSSVADFAHAVQKDTGFGVTIITTNSGARYAAVSFSIQPLFFYKWVTEETVHAMDLEFVISKSGLAKDIDPTDMNFLLHQPWWHATRNYQTVR